MSDRANQGRRGFLAACGRYTVAGLLAGGVGVLALRDRRTCREPDLCHGCAALQDCDLPPAVSARQTGTVARRTGIPACPRPSSETRDKVDP